MSAGKGSSPRNCFSQQYRDNYEAIFNQPEWAVYYEIPPTRGISATAVQAPTAGEARLKFKSKFPDLIFRSVGPMP